MPLRLGLQLLSRQLVSIGLWSGKGDAINSSVRCGKILKPSATRALGSDVASGGVGVECWLLTVDLRNHLLVCSAITESMRSSCFIAFFANTKPIRQIFI